MVTPKASQMHFREPRQMRLPRLRAERRVLRLMPLRRLSVQIQIVHFHLTIPGR